MNASSETLIRNPQIEWSGELLSASFPRLFAPPLFVWLRAFDRELAKSLISIF